MIKYKQMSNEYKLQWAREHKESVKVSKDKYAKNNVQKIRAKNSAYKSSIRPILRNDVIYLYSHGTNLCKCGSPIEELHHTNPEDGTWESKTFGSRSCREARLHQIGMYTVIPNYIQPLCKVCHRAAHKQLKERIK